MFLSNKNVKFYDAITNAQKILRNKIEPGNLTTGGVIAFIKRYMREEKVWIKKLAMASVLSSFKIIGCFGINICQCDSRLNIMKKRKKIEKMIKRHQPIYVTLYDNNGNLGKINIYTGVITWEEE